MPEGEASITPGVMMYTDGAQCTANFVFRDAAGRRYVGYAAHCAGLGEATDTNGCSTPSLPLGTRVRFAEGGSLADDGTTVGHGRLAYSSWLSMQAAGESGVNPCTYNDFALVRVAKGSRAEVNPTVPFFGGPTKVDRSGTEAGDQVFSYGNSSIRGGVEQLSPKFGFSVGDTGGGGSHTVSTLTPGIPGDSGSGFLDDKGRALARCPRSTLPRHRRRTALVTLAASWTTRRPIPGSTGCAWCQGPGSSRRWHLLAFPRSQGSPPSEKSPQMSA